MLLKFQILPNCIHGENKKSNLNHMKMRVVTFTLKYDLIFKFLNENR